MKLTAKFTPTKGRGPLSPRTVSLDGTDETQVLTRLFKEASRAGASEVAILAVAYGAKDRLEVCARLFEQLVDAVNSQLLQPIPVGTEVRYHGISQNRHRRGKVAEAPGPSAKYGGRDAERYEVLFYADTDDQGKARRATTAFADRGDLEVIAAGD